MKKKIPVNHPVRSSLFFDMEIIPVASLKPRDRNPRTHSKKQILQIVKSIEEFGFINPILTDARGRIIAGHGRVEAVKLLGMKLLPAIRLEGMSEAQLRAYALADNRLAQISEWDEELCALEFKYIQELQIDFDLELTGFETAEIDRYLEILNPAGEDPAADSIPEADPAEPPVSRFGDLWRLGRHRLLCGDATQRDEFLKLLGDQKAQLVFTDPPYNVPIDGHVSGLGAVRHEDFRMASGEMTEAEYTDFLRTAFTHLAAFSTDGAIHFICADWRHAYEFLTAGRAVYSELKNLIVWVKTNAGMGTFYRSQHELIFAFKNGTSPHINNFELGQHGRHRANVWSYAGGNAFKPDRLEELAMHPTVKPVAMIADALKDCSKRGGVVLDPFAGSGTILIAAQKTGRRAYAMEIEPKYVDTAIRRWEEYSGGEATHAENFLTFAQIKEERAHGR